MLLKISFSAESAEEHKTVLKKQEDSALKTSEKMKNSAKEQMINIESGILCFLFEGISTLISQKDCRNIYTIYVLSLCLIEKISVRCDLAEAIPINCQFFLLLVFVSQSA